MSEWLTVIIVLLIVAVLLDGWRRMRQSNRQSIKVSRSVRKGKATDASEDEGYGSELPNGGARVATVRNEDDARQLNRNLQENFEQSKGTIGKPRLPKKVSLNLDENVPMLMDPVDQAVAEQEPHMGHVDNFLQDGYEAYEDEKQEREQEDEQEVTPSEITAPVESHDELIDDLKSLNNSETFTEVFSETSHTLDKADIDEEYEQTSDVLTADAQTIDAQKETDESEAVEVSPLKVEKGQDSENELEQQPLFDEELLPDDLAPEEQPRRAKKRSSRKKASDDEHASGMAEQPSLLDAEPEEVIIINVTAPAEKRLNGNKLKDVVLQCGMCFGEMQIFHRYENDEGEGPLQFSMVNMVVPGTFDFNSMDVFETPGVSLFMTLPMQANSMDAFEAMAGTAQAIAKNLGGELKDEQRSVMTQQTLEHCRQRIRDFERKQLSRS